MGRTKKITIDAGVAEPTEPTEGKSAELVGDYPISISAPVNDSVSLKESELAKVYYEVARLARNANVPSIGKHVYELLAIVDNGEYLFSGEDITRFLNIFGVNIQYLIDIAVEERNTLHAMKF